MARDTAHAAVARCGGDEIAALLAGLDGRAVAPGPSGAPTRGRADVLPTGRNFFSVDTRTVPTQAAFVRETPTRPIASGAAISNPTLCDR